MCILDDVKNSGSSQDSSVHTSEIPAIDSDAVCVAPQNTTALPTDRVPAETTGMVTEMTDPSDISNVSAADWVRTTYRNPV